MEADDKEAAVQRAESLGISPGGEVMAVRVPKGEEHLLPVEKLMSLAELEAIDEVVMVSRNEFGEFGEP